MLERSNRGVLLKTSPTQGRASLCLLPPTPAISIRSLALRHGEDHCLLSVKALRFRSVEPHGGWPSRGLRTLKHGRALSSGGSLHRAHRCYASIVFDVFCEVLGSLSQMLRHTSAASHFTSGFRSCHRCGSVTINLAARARQKRSRNPEW